MFNFISNYKQILLYGVLLATLIFLLKWLQWKFLISDNSIEIYIGLIAIFFTIFGAWIAKKFIDEKVKTIVVEKEIYLSKDNFELNIKEIKNLGISNRELEVLELIATGNSNAEIANQLFLSVSTIKSHISNLFSKLDVKNRVQAIEKAKKLSLIK